MPLTVRRADFVLLPAPFEAVILSLNPEREYDTGVPEMIPVDVSNVSPSGRVPEMLHVIGVLPLVSLKPDEYGELSAAFARDPDNFGAIPFIVRGSMASADPAEFDAVNFTLNVPNSSGQPEILPLSLSVRPCGSPSAVHVIGDVPDDLSVNM